MDDALCTNLEHFTPVGCVGCQRFLTLKRPKYEVNLSYITDDVSKLVTNSNASPSQGSVALICELLDVCTLINSN